MDVKLVKLEQLRQAVERANKLIGEVVSAVVEAIEELDNAKLSKTGGILTGNLTGKYISGTLLQTTDTTRLGSAPTKYPVLDDSGWIYYRTADDTKNDLGIISESKVAEMIDEAVGSVLSAQY